MKIIFLLLFLIRDILFSGAACNTCNMNRRESPFMKIFAHNFSGYDSHLIIERLARKDIHDIQVIPKSGEKFMTVSINNFYTFCDSMNFLSGSLDSLTKTLPTDHGYYILKQSSLHKRVRSPSDFKLLFYKWKYRNTFFKHWKNIFNKIVELFKKFVFFLSLWIRTIHQGAWELYRNTWFKLFSKQFNRRYYLERWSWGNKKSLFTSRVHEFKGIHGSILHAGCIPSGWGFLWIPERMSRQLFHRPCQLHFTTWIKLWLLPKENQSCTGPGLVW